MFWVLTIVLLCLSVVLGGKPFIVDTGYAKYLGRQTYPNNVVYLGIPYAEPPLGDLRYRAPVPLNTSRLAESLEIVDAGSYAEFCVQGSHAGSYIVQKMIIF